MSATQLERWRRVGLLPRAARSFPGDGGSRATLPDGTLEQALFLSARYRRGRPWQVVALEVAAAGRWLTGEAAATSLRWAVDRNRNQRLEWAQRHAEHIEKHLADDESETEFDETIAIIWALTSTSAEVANGLLGFEGMVARANPRLRGADLAEEVQRHHEALLQASEGVDLSPETRSRALIVLGIKPTDPSADDALAFIRLLSDVDYLPSLARELSPDEALDGCRQAAALLATGGVGDQPVAPVEVFAMCAVVLALPD